MDDAQKRAQAFNDQQRIAELETLLADEREAAAYMRCGAAARSRERNELEAEVARLRRELKQRRAEDEVHALVRGLKALAAGRVVVTKLLKTKAKKTLKKRKKP